MRDPWLSLGLLLAFLLVLASCGPSTSSPDEGESVQPTPSPIVTSPFPEMGPVTVVATIQAEPTPLPTPTPNLKGDGIVVMRFESPSYGIQTFLWWDPETLAKRDLALVNEMEFSWVKQIFAWRDVETLVKGSYDWWRTDAIVNEIENAGLNLLVRIDRQPFWASDGELLENAPPTNLDDFGDYCGALAERYAGRIAAYEVWNEPNLTNEWGWQPPDPVEYTALLRVCYEAIKAADPAAIVVSAGLAPTGTGLPQAMPAPEFLQGMYDAGADNYFDVLGLHAPGFKAPPDTPPELGETVPEYGDGRWFVFRHVEDMRIVMVENGDSHRQVAITEMGWTTDPVHPSYSWYAVDELTQAQYLSQAYQYAAEHWSPWVGLMSTIYIADRDWDPIEHEQYWWSIVLPDGTPRQAFYALRDMPK